VLEVNLRTVGFVLPAAMISNNCAGDRSTGSPVPAPTARPFVLACVMSASLALVTASLAIVTTPAAFCVASPDISGALLRPSANWRTMLTIL
jgi:hypothetical protein